MRHKTLGIWDVDREYAQALARAIARRYREYQVTVLTDWPEGGHEPWDILLVGELTGEERIYANAGANDTLSETVVIQLTEEERGGIQEAMRSTENRQPQLYKYERVGELVKGIRFWYRYVTGEQTMLSGDRQMSKMLAITAAVDRALPETTVMLAEELAAREQKVLLLSFAEFATVRPHDEQSQQKRVGLEEYLYYLLGARKESVCQQLELFLVNADQGYASFPSHSYRNPLRALSPEELESFLTSVLMAGFDYVVVNLGSGTGSHSALLLDGCTELLLPEAADEGEQLQNQNLLAYLHNQVEGTGPLTDKLFVLGQQTVEGSLGRWAANEDEQTTAPEEIRHPDWPSITDLSAFSTEARRKEVRAYVHRITDPLPQCPPAYCEGDHGGDSQCHQQPRWRLKR